MKLAILAVLAIIILGGGGAGAYFYFGQPAQASIGETPAHQEAAEVDDEESADGEHAGGKKHKFVELAPLILPVIDDGGISQIVSIVVVIEVEGDSNEKKVQSLEPRLKDAYIQELYGVLNRHDAMKDGVLQVGMIKERLGQISERVLGEGVMQEVLLQVVQQRPI